VLGGVPFQRAGVASASTNTVRQLFAAFGVALLGAVMVAEISTVGRADLAVTNLPIAIKNSLGGLLTSGLTGGLATSVQQGTDPSILGQVQFVITVSITQGFRWATFVSGIFVFFGTLASLLIPNPKPIPAKAVPVEAQKVLSQIPSASSG